MSVFRRHIVSLTLGWLLCQAAAFAAPPALVCSMCLDQADEVPECCRNLKPGQTCPMHSHGDESGETCHMRSRCLAHDASLLALAAGLAAPPVEPTSVWAAVKAPEALALVPTVTIARVAPPEAPPPRR